MNRNWVGKAACSGLDPAVFYPPTDEDADEAKAICAACPVQEPCLEHAIEMREKKAERLAAQEAKKKMEALDGKKKTKAKAKPKKKSTAKPRTKTVAAAKAGPPDLGTRRTKKAGSRKKTD